MDEKELISIIIPVYNIGEQIDTMLDSVVCQSYSYLEIILVDDGSTDNSGILCEKWTKKDDRIRCIHQNNSGVSAARNTGFYISRGAYILFLDGDDRIADDMCEKLLKNMKEKKSDISYCGFLNIFKDRVEKHIPKTTLLTGSEISDALITDAAFYPSVWNKLFKREILFGDNGKFIEFPVGIYLSEDALWLSRILKNAKTASAVDQPLYFWYRRSDSATLGGEGVRTDTKYLTMLKAYREMVLEFEDEKTRNRMCKKYLGTCRDCMIKAYKEKKYDLCNELKRHIYADKKVLYRKIDIFTAKLDICVFLVTMRVPAFFIEMIQKIK